MSDEKQLPTGEKRFIAKPRQQGKHATWNVYDRQRASLPAQVPGFGAVASGFTDETACQAEADRLAAFVTGDVTEEASDG
jgi:hypothetical protein